MHQLSYDDEISPTRKALDQAIVGGIEMFLRFFAAHWLALINLVNFGFFGGALLDPYLYSIGASKIAVPMFHAYHYVCHQLPYRSDSIFGYQVAMCQRNMAIYTSMFLAGVGFAFVRGNLKPLPLRWYLVLITPMAIDGFTQLFGWRESNWMLRTTTGTLFGVATVWLSFPTLEIAMRQMAREVVRKDDPKVNKVNIGGGHQ